MANDSSRKGSDWARPRTAATPPCSPDAVAIALPGSRAIERKTLGGPTSRVYAAPGADIDRPASRLHTGSRTVGMGERVGRGRSVAIAARKCLEVDLSRGAPPGRWP